MNKFTWGRIQEDDVYIDNFNLRNIRIMEVRETYAKLASVLVDENKTEKAIEVLDKIVEILPEHKVSYGASMNGIIDNYLKVGEKEKAYSILDLIIKDYSDKMNYYNKIGERYSDQIYAEKAELYDDVKKLIVVTDKHRENVYSDKLKTLFLEY